MTCAFAPCDEVDRTTCPLPGGCVVLRFAGQPKYKAKSLLEEEGLRKTARKGSGTAQKKAPKRK